MDRGFHGPTKTPSNHSIPLHNPYSQVSHSHKTSPNNISVATTEEGSTTPNQDTLLANGKSASGKDGLSAIVLL